MRLKHITFTGIDAKTDIKALQEIQLEFPLVEFGVLTYGGEAIASFYPNRKLDSQKVYCVERCKRVGR